MTWWQDDQRVLCDALLDLGYRVEMWAGICVWVRRNDPCVVHRVWSVSNTTPGRVWPVLGLGAIGSAATVPEVVALVTTWLDLDGRRLPMNCRCSPEPNRSGTPSPSPPTSATPRG